MAKLSKPPIPLKLYKHFAVATLSLTAAIAMFADDNSRRAMAEDFEARQETGEVRRASANQFADARLVRNDTQNNAGNFGSENVPSAGGSRGSSGSDRRASRGSRPPVPGYEQDFIDELRDEDYRALLESLPEELRESVDPQEAREQRRRMERASARRSGHSGSGSDAPG